MNSYPQGTNVSVIIGINDDSRPEVTALPDKGHGPRIHVAFDRDVVRMVGDPEDVLAFARALVTEVEKAVPVDLLLTEWDKADEVPA